MRIIERFARAACALLFAVGIGSTARAADFAAQRAGDYVIKDFRFASGQVLPELKMHYTTLGDPGGEPVLILHGTTGSGTGMLSAPFGSELFGPGQPLDAAKYYVILPDSIGTGQSSKPSDGLHAKFPQYDYDDAVRAQYQLVTAHLGVRHLRLVLGNSMGGMMTWIWAEQYPSMLDIAVPMASLPVAMGSRNWALRRFLVDSIKNDPEWMGGDYQKQPRSWQFATTYFSLATNGGSQHLYRLAPTSAKADAMIDHALAAPMKGDANDHLYQWASSRDYDPSAGLEKIQATVLAINSADDERNPTELGVLDSAMKRVRHGSVLLIPASPNTFGHGTTAHAEFWKDQLAELLKTAPRQP